MHGVARQARDGIELDHKRDDALQRTFRQSPRPRRVAVHMVDNVGAVLHIGAVGQLQHRNDRAADARHDIGAKIGMRRRSFDISQAALAQIGPDLAGIERMRQAVEDEHGACPRPHPNTPVAGTSFSQARTCARGSASTRVSSSSTNVSLRWLS